MKIKLFTCLLFLLYVHQVGIAERKNDVEVCCKVLLKKIDNTDVSSFLLKSNDLQLMILKGGEQAIDKGTVADIKAYGELMVKDKTMILEEIRELAKARDVSLPDEVSKAKSEDLEDLRAKKGVAFNKAFVKMIKKTQKQALRNFKTAASKLDDKEVCAFASKNSYIINLELIRIEKIEAKM